jgi:hypothetical protein
MDVGPEAQAHRAQVEALFTLRTFAASCSVAAAAMHSTTPWTAHFSTPISFATLLYRRRERPSVPNRVVAPLCAVLVSVSLRQPVATRGVCGAACGHAPLAQKLHRRV